MLETFIAWSVPALLASVLHEAAHALVAWRLGDDTACRAGRLSLNPARHVDALATLALSALVSVLVAPMLWLWLKPVPFDPAKLTGLRLSCFALAGPAANAVMLTAWVVSGPSEMAVAGATINLVFMLVNMLPVPPLDGWRAMQGLKS